MDKMMLKIKRLESPICFNQIGLRPSMVVNLFRHDLPPIYLLRHGETMWNAAGRFHKIDA